MYVCIDYKSAPTIINNPAKDIMSHTLTYLSNLL